MGATASSQKQSSEGEHFASIINPPSEKRPRSAGKKPSQQKLGVEIHMKSKILKKVSHEVLWDSFLSSSLNSFALTHSEIATLLESSLLPQENPEAAKSDVDLYIELITELTEKDVIKAVDFMAVCSSVLFFSDLSIESKIDCLYVWICLDDSRNGFCFDDFFVAMMSFERGLSHAMGKSSCSESHLRSVASQWFTIADPLHKGTADGTTLIDLGAFFDFCTNRSSTVRKLLEALGASEVRIDDHGDMSEIVDIVLDEQLPSPGDEFLANPAWKQIAQKMIPKGIIQDSSKPTANLKLEWVHGYRGFDCRNNLFYITATGTQMTFPAASLSIVQVSSEPFVVTTMFYGFFFLATFM